MLVGTDVCVPVVFVWEETGVPNCFLMFLTTKTFINQIIYKAMIHEYTEYKISEIE